MILILDQKKDCSRDWKVGNFHIVRRKEIQSAIGNASFVAVKLEDDSGYHVFKNRDGRSGYTVKGELALNQLILDNLIPRKLG